MLIVDALTNNVNRTASDVRAAFGKNGGNMGVSGSVSYMFDHTAVIAFEGKTADETLELLLEADLDARDILEEDNIIIIYAEPDQLQAVQEALKQAGVNEFNLVETSMLPQTELSLGEEDEKQLEKLIDALDDLEDVQQVYHNVALSED